MPFLAIAPKYLNMLAIRSLILFLIVFSSKQLLSQDFSWPQGKQMALSLSFDDARESQVTVGKQLLDSMGVKVTFYVNPGGVRNQMLLWRAAVKSGHEIANHSLTHPCSGNFVWSRKYALEDLSLRQMENQLVECTRQIKEMLGVDTRIFAYPCGQTYVGKGLRTKSYVPLVAKHFQSGRGWMNEAPNDPLHCNFDQLYCIPMDGKSFEELLPIIEGAKKNGQWLIFGGHEINTSGDQTTRTDTIRKLGEYVKDPANGIWTETVGTIGNYIKEKRGVL